MSYGLVLLEMYPLSDVRITIDRFHRSVRLHSEEAEARLIQAPPPAEPTLRSLREIVRSDHRGFEISFEQLDWFLRIAEGDGHGGNRQALGQYGRLVAEAVRRHLADEGRLGAPVAEPVEKP